jgi:hypothetical protein
MGLVSEIAATALLGPGRIGIERALHQLARRPLLGRAARLGRLRLARRHCRFGRWLFGRRLGPLHRRVDQAGVDQRALPHDQAQAVDLAVDLLEHPISQITLPQRLAEAMDRHMVRRLGVQRKAAEPSEAQAILDRRLQGGVRQPIPLLQKQCLEHHYSRVTRCPVPRSMHRRQQSRERRPVDQSSQPLQRLVPAGSRDQTIRQAQLPQRPLRHPLDPRFISPTESRTPTSEKVSQAGEGEESAPKKPMGAPLPLG